MRTALTVAPVLATCCAVNATVAVVAVAINAPGIAAVAAAVWFAALLLQFVQIVD